MVSFAHHVFSQGPHGLSLATASWAQGIFGELYTLDPFKYTIDAIKAGTSNVDVSKEKLADILNYKRQPAQADQENAGEDFVLGQSGCGLCALWQLRDAGITHVKLVSRGNYTADTIEDIRQLKNALNILEKSACEKDYKKQMKSRLFANDCSHNCYYITEN